MQPTDLREIERITRLSSRVCTGCSKTLTNGNAKCVNCMFNGG